MATWLRTWKEQAVPPQYIRRLQKSDTSLAQLYQKDINDLFKNYPELSKVHKPFMEFRNPHLKEMNNLLMRISEASKKGIQDAIQCAKDAIDIENVNPKMAKRALGIFITHSEEAQKFGLIAPSIKHYNEFVSVTEEGQPLLNPATGDTMKGVQLLTYWREDYDFNDHHIHWHMVYPGAGIPKHHESDKMVRTIDRQGELFIYMHSQMVARYDAESLSWGLGTTPTWGYDDVLIDGYTPVPGLIDGYGARPPNQGWYETHNPHIPDDVAPVTKAVMIKWRDNILRAIDDGYFVSVNKVTKKKGKLILTPENARNWVGVVVEAESTDLHEIRPHEFIDEERYGNLHNFGHDKFAEIGYHEYLSNSNPLGVMTSNFASPRDPCFWPWHRHVEEFSLRVMKKYSHDLNEFKPDAELIALEILPQNSNSPTPANGISTILGPPQLHLNEANAKVNHEPYKWEIKIMSKQKEYPTKAKPQIVTVRLFIVPEALLQDQRAWIEMDKFTCKLTKQMTRIIRNDVESSVARKLPTEGKTATSWCLCGWPQNMMLPVGTPEGMPFVAFGMLTNDQLGQDNKTPAISYCGAQLKTGKYPDPRGMGYPFDKTWKQRQESTHSVEEIIRSLTHTALYKFKIYRHTYNYRGKKVGPKAKTVTWENTIKHFFTERDKQCMKSEYGYNFDSHDDVALHAAGIYDATSKKRMPKQMPPYTQEDPDPKHPMWTQEMCDKFYQWMHEDPPCP